MSKSITTYTQELPKDFIKLAVDAIRNYQTFIESLDIEANQLDYIHFDIKQIRQFLKSKVLIEMTEEEYKNFSSCGIDYPEFDEGYDIQVSSEKTYPVYDIVQESPDGEYKVYEYVSHREKYWLASFADEQNAIDFKNNSMGGL